jgi:hypothetical protein
LVLKPPTGGILALVFLQREPRFKEKERFAQGPTAGGKTGDQLEMKAFLGPTRNGKANTAIWQQGRRKLIIHCVVVCVPSEFWARCALSVYTTHTHTHTHPTLIDPRNVDGHTKRESPSMN